MAADSFNTDYFNDAWMAYFLNNTTLPTNFPGTSSGPNVWLGLSTTIPTRDQSSNGGTNWNVTELSGGGYARVQLACSTANFKKVVPGTYAVISCPPFPVPSSTQSTNGLPVLAICFFDAASGGNLLHADTRLINPQWFDNQRGALCIPDGFLRVGIRCYGARRGIISEYLADAFVAHNYAGGNLIASRAGLGFGIYIRLLTSMPSPATAGALIGTGWQYTGGCYLWNKIKMGIYANSAQLIGVAGAQADLPCFAACDASSSGNLLFAGPLNAPCGVSALSNLPTIYPNGLQLGLGR
ncbi:MAG: hypothetical protein KGL39_08000 [Patescibacteria group bacterium]|nr:hypothetical protein [Patescibacteria group bacterium]